MTPQPLRETDIGLVMMKSLVWSLQTFSRQSPPWQWSGLLSDKQYQNILHILPHCPLCPTVFLHKGEQWCGGWWVLPCFLDVFCVIYDLIALPHCGWKYKKLNTKSITIKGLFACITLQPPPVKIRTESKYLMTGEGRMGWTLGSDPGWRWSWSGDTLLSLRIRQLREGWILSL